MDFWRICEHCGAQYATLATLQAHMSGPECLKRQLAAANAKLQERSEAFEMAREAYSHTGAFDLGQSKRAFAELDAYFATGEKEG